MATSYRMRDEQIKNQPTKVRGSWFSRHKTLMIFLGIVFAFVAWFNSDYWPWPFEWQRDNRLDRVLETCTNNETSSECKSIQKRLNITFKYCHSIGDWGKKKTIYINGKPYEWPDYPWYAVAWEGSSSEPPKSGSGIGSFSQYYGCQESAK